MRPRQVLFLILISCCQCSALLAQAPDWDILMQQLADEGLATDVDDDDIPVFEAFMDELAELHERPMDINHVSVTDLARLPFLDEAKAQAVIAFRERYGEFRSVGDLRLIPALGERDLRLLSLCIRVERDRTADATHAATHDRHDVMSRLSVPLYERQGWSWPQGLAHRLRYTGSIARRWDVGLRAETDEGEPMFDRRNPLWDAWGAHVMLSNYGRVERAILGDYKASVGEGLILNNNFNLGKQFTSLWRRTAVIRPHRSADEVNFMRGAAATFKITPPHFINRHVFLS